MTKRILQYGIALMLLQAVFTGTCMAQQKEVISQNRKVVHSVLFKFLSGTPRYKVDSLMTQITELKKRVPGIIDIYLGRNFSTRSKGFTDAVTIVFTDKAALQLFIASPVHQHLISNYIKPILEDMIVTDYIDETITLNH